MSDDSPPTPRTEAETSTTPDEASPAEKPVRATRRKPSTTGTPRKRRPRPPATSPAVTDEPVAADPVAEVPQTDAETAPAEPVEVPTPDPVAEPVEVPTSDPVATPVEVPAPDPEAAPLEEPTPDPAVPVEVPPPELVTVPEAAEPSLVERIFAPDPAAPVEPSQPPTAADPAPDHSPPAVVPVVAQARPGATAGPVTLAQALDNDGVRRVLVTLSYLFCLVGALAAFGLVDGGSRRLSAALLPVVVTARCRHAGRSPLVGGAAGAGRVRGLAVVAGPCRGGPEPSHGVPVRAHDGGARDLVLRDPHRGAVSGAILSVIVVAALMGTLRAAGRVPSRGFVGRQCAQLGFAAALGWMSVLAAGAIAGALVTHKVPAYFVSAETWGILGTTALLAFGMMLVRYFPGRLYIAAALSWGFICIAYARVTGQPRAYFVAVVALICALLILIAGVAVFLWARGRVRERVG